MLKKLGLQKDHDSANVSSTSPSGSKLLDIEKMKTRHNKKVVRKTMSYDSLESESFAPEPHMPSTIYHPNPFPLDPSQPDGISRHNAFHTRHETREVETVDIEVEETKGFVSGKSRRSIDGGDHFDSNREDHRNNYDEDAENSKVNYTIQKLGAGLKGALAKSGLGKSKDKEKEKEKENTEVDAVLQYQQQQKQQQKKRLQDADITTQAQARGRERARERTQSGHIYPERLTGNDAKSPDRNREKRGAYSEHRSRLHSLSPPPAPGQERRNSDSYWPEDHRAGIHSEQMTPFIGYQPPPISPSRRQHQQYQQQQRQQRPLSLTSDSEYGERSGRDGRYKSRERAGGVRRHSGLNQVTAAESPIRTSSELGDDESSSVDRQPRQQQIPDRLSRAKEWVANHSRNNSIAAPAPVIDREAALSSIPGALPSRPNRRYSMDPEEYGLISPPRGSYLSNAGGGYDSRERMAMMTRMKAQGQEQRDYRESMTDDGRYWSRQLEGYEYDRYRQSRVDYEYGGPGGYRGYPAGDDDIDDVESTLAPGSIVGVSPAKKGLENPTDASKRSTTNVGDDLEQDQLAAPKPPNRKRLILRLVSLFSSLFVLLFLIAAAPVSHSSSPFSSSAGLAFHYVVAILSIIVSLAFVFNYWSRRLRRREKMKRYILFALDIIMTIAWLVDIFVCISKFPCAVGGQHGWCDMYNSSVFLAMVAFVSYLVAFVWDIWGSFDHSKIFTGPIIKPAPPGFDGKGRGGRKLASGGMGQGAGGVSAPGAWPGQVPGQQLQQQQQQGQGFPMKPKNSKALW